MTDEPEVEVVQPEVVHPPRRLMGSRLLDVQQRYRELGRLRMGKQVSMGGGKSRPTKLDTWRLTSASRALLEVAAAVYGGTVERWKDAPGEGEWWELITESASLRIAVPPGEVLSQFWEQWSGGGCKKRCDGINQILVDRRCSCPADIAARLEKAKEGKACNPVTRLSVLLPDVPDIGVWRLETHGMNAATELPGTYDILRQAAEIGSIIPARLTIQARQSKKEGQGTQKFRVPAIEIEQKLHEVAAGIHQLGAGEGSQDRTMLPAAQPPVERRNMVSTGAPLSTDEGQVSQASSVESFDAPDQRAPAPSPRQGTVLSDWILALPGSDGEILDAAMDLSAEAGSPRELHSLKDLDALGLNEQSQAQLRERLEQLLAAEPEQGSLT